MNVITNYHEIIDNNIYFFDNKKCPVINIGIIGSNKFITEFINMINNNTKSTINFSINPVDNLNKLHIILFLNSGPILDTNVFLSLLALQHINNKQWWFYGNIDNSIKSLLPKFTIDDNLKQFNNLNDISYEIGIRLQKLSYKYRCESKYWKQLHDRVIMNADYMCQGCGASNTPLIAHHRTYRNLGTGKEIHDLIALCPICHKRIHGR